jgi:hypothetical protein
VREREAKRRARSHGEPADDGTGRAEVVEHAAEIGDERRRRIRRRVARRRAPRVAARVEADDTVAVAERARLRSEVARATGEPVREDDRRARPLRLDVQPRLGHPHDGTRAAPPFPWLVAWASFGGQGGIAMIKLYGVPRSRTMRALWMLEELGMPYENVKVSFVNETRKPDFLRLNPNGHIPVLQDGDVLLWSRSRSISTSPGSTTRASGRSAWRTRGGRISGASGR